MIVRLRDDPSKTPEWRFTDRSGAHISEFSEKTAENADIVVLVPGTDVFLTALKLPKLSRKQRLKAIPFFLERHLAETWPQFHWVSAAENAEGMLPVAVVSREKMDAWQICLNVFFHMQFPAVKMMIPDMLVLPLDPAGWTVHCHEGTALVRTGLYSGFSIESGEFWTVLRLFLKQPDFVRPETITLIGEMIVPPEELAFLGEGHIALRKVESENLLDFAQSNGDMPEGMDLLQGFSHPYRFVFQPALLWLSGILLILILSVLSGGALLQTLRLKSALSHLKDANHAVYHRYFSGKKASDNTGIRQQMLLLQKGGEGLMSLSDFTAMLEDIAPLILNTGEIRLTGIDFSADRLSFRLETADAAHTDHLVGALKTRYKIKAYKRLKSANFIRAVVSVGRN